MRRPSSDFKRRPRGTRTVGAALVLVVALAHLHTVAAAHGKIILVGTLSAGKTFVCNQLEGGDGVCGTPSDSYKAGTRKCHNTTEHVIDTIGLGHNVKEENRDMTGTTVSVMNTLECAEGEDVSAVVYVLRCEGANRIGADTELEALATFMSLMGGTKLYIYFNADVNGNGACPRNKGLQAINEAVADYGLRFDAVMDASTLNSGSTDILRAPGATVTLPAGWRDTLRNSDAKVAAERVRQHQESHCADVERAAKAAAERVAAASAAVDAARAAHGKLCGCERHAKGLQQCKMAQPAARNCYSMVCAEQGDQTSAMVNGAAAGAAATVLSGGLLAPLTGLGAALGWVFGGGCQNKVRVADESCLAANAAALQAAKAKFDDCRNSYTRLLDECKTGLEACRKRADDGVDRAQAELDAASAALEKLEGTRRFCADILFKSR